MWYECNVLNKQERYVYEHSTVCVWGGGGGREQQHFYTVIIIIHAVAFKSVVAGGVKQLLEEVRLPIQGQTSRFDQWWKVSCIRLPRWVFY